VNAHVAEMARRARAGVESREIRKQLRIEASKHGATPVCAALKEHPVSKGLETLQVERLLCFIPGITPPKADALLEAVPCRLTATVGELTYRKRVLLVALLEGSKKSSTPRPFADQKREERRRRAEATTESDRLGRRRMAGAA
jgi:hypothetical protein